MAKISNTDLIRQEIQNRFKRAASNGSSTVDILAGDLHEKVVFNDGSHPNQMPSIYNMMYEASYWRRDVIFTTKGSRWKTTYSLSNSQKVKCAY